MDHTTRAKLDYMHSAVVAMQRRIPKRVYRPRPVLGIEALQAECLRRFSPALYAYLRNNPPARPFPY